MSALCLHVDLQGLPLPINVQCGQCELAVCRHPLLALIVITGGLITQLRPGRDAGKQTGMTARGDNKNLQQAKQIALIGAVLSNLIACTSRHSFKALPRSCLHLQIKGLDFDRP